METAIAVVTEISGEVYARAADGSLRSLQPGDQLFAGETLVTAESGQVVLDFGNGEVAEFGPNQALGMTEQMLGSTEPVPFDNQITDPSVAAVLAALDGEGDLLDDLEAPAAGTDGAPDGGGSSIVQLVRVFESIDPLAFSFDQEPVEPFEAPIGEQDGELLADAGEPETDTPADIPEPPQLTVLSPMLVNIYGSSAITTAPGMIDVDSFTQGVMYNNIRKASQSISADELENILGLDPSALSQFDPPETQGGTVQHSGTVEVRDGKYSSFTVMLQEGASVKFDWTFLNGENNPDFIENGKNDLVVLVITAPNGDRRFELISSSEQAQAAAQMSDKWIFSSLAGNPGEYRFDWIILNGGDTNFDSALLIESPSVSLDGSNYYSQPIDLSIQASLTSGFSGEVLTVEISGAPAGSIFTAGTDIGGGVWSFTEDDLAGLQLLPPIGFQGDITLNISAQSSLNGIDSAVAEVEVTITVNETPYGMAIKGTDSDDELTGTAGDDYIWSGAGNDILTGGGGSDVFAWKLGDEGSSVDPAFDIITDFTLGQFGTNADMDADRLDLKDILSDFNPQTDSITDYLAIETSLDGTMSTIHISPDGTGVAGISQSIQLQGVDLASLGDSDTEIILSLITSGNLVVS